MRIDKKLNLVIPILNDDGTAVVNYVHAVPLGADIIDRHFMVLGQTFSQIFTQGLGAASGPGMAMRLLRKTAEVTGVWDGPEGVAETVVAEIRRTAMVMTRDPASGWQAVPLQVAAERKMISEDDRQEVEAAIVFFIVVSATLARAQRKQMLEVAADLWGAQLSVLSSTEYMSSLRTSTATVNSGANGSAAVPVTPVPANATSDGKPLSVPH